MANFTRWLLLFSLFFGSELGLAINYPIGQNPTVIVAAQTTGADVTSPTINIQGVSNIDIQLVWTSTTHGTTSVNVSEDGTNWDPLVLSGAVTPGGSPGHGTIELTGLAAPLMQVVFTRTDGTGTMTMTAFAKIRQ